MKHISGTMPVAKRMLGMRVGPMDDASLMADGHRDSEGP